MTKKLFLIIITFFALSSTAFSERPNIIDLQKFTCKDFIALHKQDREEAEDDADERATQAIVWLGGYLTENKILRFLPLGFGFDQLLHDCEEKPSASILTIFTSIYKELSTDHQLKALENTSKEPLSFKTDQLTCQNFLNDEIFADGMQEILLSWIDGNLSKTLIINLKTPQYILPELIKKCQKSLSAKILPLIQKIGQYK